MKQYNKKIKLAFHVHTCWSKDSLSEPADIVKHCRENGIGVIAICDHNEIGGALEVEKLAKGNPKVIIGEEIKTEKGEIIGLFLKEKISKDMSIDEAIKEIRRQGGLVCIPHPGESFRRSATSKRDVINIIEKIDIIETPNSRTLLGQDNRWAERVARKYNRATVAGSDAHNLSEIDCALVEMNQFFGKENFIRRLGDYGYRVVSISKTNIFRQLISIFVRIFS